MPTNTTTVHHSLGLRVVATVEATKGLAVLLAGFGVLLLVHRDVQAAAERIVAHLHLNPASRYPRIFLRAATESTPGRLRLLALGAFGYSTLRFVEAGGLWHERRWAEWFAVATGLIYVPFEAVAFARSSDVEPLLALVLNLAIVLFMGIQLRRGSNAAGNMASRPRNRSRREQYLSRRGVLTEVEGRMSEVLRSFDASIRDESGEYHARVVGSPTNDGMWQGWFEFVPIDGGDTDTLISPVESRQPNRQDLAYWATGLTAVYAEGALRRARNPIVVQMRVLETPVSDAPAPRPITRTN